MKRRLTSVTVGAAILMTAILAAQTVDPGVAKIAEQYQAAFNKGDAKAVGAMYTANATRLAPNGQLLTGKAAIEQEYQTNFAGPFKGTKLTLRAGQSQRVTADVAVIEGTYEVTGTPNVVRGRYVNTVVREGGQWRLASVVTVPEAGTPAK